MKKDKSANRKKRKEFIGVIFKCCNVYGRIYLNTEGTAFVGWCPKCASKLTVTVSPEGTSDRFFVVE